MITLDDALQNTEFWHMTFTNADGTPMRCRKNGAVKTWVTRPGEFRVPVKRGLKDCFYIQHVVGSSNIADWCTPAKWPAEHVIYEGL